MNMIDLQPLILTLKLALVVTFILFVVSLPLANWLAHSKSKFKPLVDTVLAMPLVLPPTVLGFYLLLAFSPASWFGKFVDQWLGLQLVFSFEGLVVASIIYSLPFMVHPIRSGLSNLPQSLREASYLLGKSEWTTLLRVLLPNIRPSVIAAIVLTFAHTVGEFGVVLMIGGNIPGVTRVASIAVYDEVESLNYSAAHIYSGVLFLVTFMIIWFVFWRQKRIKI